MNTLTVRRFMQIDVFTDQPGYGNALAVVLDAQDLSASSMQRLAAWTNLSETSFLLPPDDTTADYKVRIFTPRQELPFAGHPSVGTAFAAMHAGIVTPHDGKLTQQCAAGVLALRIEAGSRCPRVHVRAPRASQRDATTAERQALLAMFPDQSADRIAASCLVNNGPSWWLVPLEDATAVRALVPDLAAMGRLCAVTDCVGVAVYGIADKASDHKVAVRAFCPNDGIAEDPVTGSANAAIGSVLFKRGQLTSIGNPYRASQGREIGRDGIVEVLVDDDGEVWIGGDCVVAITGELAWN